MCSALLSGRLDVPRSISSGATESSVWCPELWRPGAILTTLFLDSLSMLCSTWKTLLDPTLEHFPSRNFEALGRQHHRRETRLRPGRHARLLPADPMPEGTNRFGEMLDAFRVGDGTGKACTSSLSAFLVVLQYVILCGRGFSCHVEQSFPWT